MIPLGTRMTIPGYGTGVASDTGSAVQGARIDLWFPTDAQALAWGTPDGHDHARLGSCHGSGPRDHGAVDERDPSQDEPTPALETLRVLLVDDHDLFRTGLRNLLEEQGVHVVGRGRRRRRGAAAARELAPDVVVMDLNMPGMSGVEATRQIAAVAPLTRVLVLTISDQDADVMDAILAGACGYLLKDASIQELMRGIRVGRAWASR